MAYSFVDGRQGEINGVTDAREGDTLTGPFKTFIFTIISRGNWVQTWLNPAPKYNHCPMKWSWKLEKAVNAVYWRPLDDICSSSSTYTKTSARNWALSFAPCINTISVNSKQYRRVLLIKKANMLIRRVRFYAGMVHIKWFGEMMTRLRSPVNYLLQLYVLKEMVILWKYFSSLAIKGNMCV